MMKLRASNTVFPADTESKDGKSKRGGWFSSLFKSSRKKDTAAKDQKSQDISDQKSLEVELGRPSPTAPFASRVSPANSFFSRASPRGRTSLGRISFGLFRRLDSSRSTPSSVDPKFFEAEASDGPSGSTSAKNSATSLTADCSLASDISKSPGSLKDRKSPLSPTKSRPSTPLPNVSISPPSGEHINVKPSTPKPPLPLPPQAASPVPKPNPPALAPAPATATAPVVNIIQLVRPRAHQNGNAIALADDLPLEMDRETWAVEDYCHLEQIHSGYASSVFRAVCKLSKRKVVLKVYQPELLHPISRHQLDREVRIHVKLKHPNIIKMWAAFKQADGVVIVQEYADGGDLLKIMTENNMKLYERNAASMVIEPLLEAISYLHSKGIMHRDIKLENILFDGASMTLKLADFGLCLSMREERAVTRAGTLDYMPPEVIACPTKDLPEDNKDRFDLAYGLGADIWSIGVLAYELINGIPPFTRHERQDTEELIMSGSLPSFLSPVSSELKDFVYSCLVESCLRPSAAFCLKHSWITGVAEPGRKVRDRRQTSTDGLGDLANFSDRGSQLKRERVPEEDEQLPETRSTSPINLLSPDPLAKPQIPALQLERQWESPILAAASKQSIESEIDEDPSSSSMMIRRFMAEGFRSAAASPTLIGQKFVNRDDSNDEFEVPDI